MINYFILFYFNENKKKSVSKKHAIIELTEKENGDFDDCLIWDVGSLNKTKFSQDVLKKDEKKSFKINDSVQFGLVRFDLVKVII